MDSPSEGRTIADQRQENGSILQAPIALESGALNPRVTLVRVSIQKEGPDSNIKSQQW
ncbi:2943_t:CDS:2 [Acaulospora colombiana]|uniref:2943_t:CDS:1 n=1 Tax=Acaulospora colombiana TaxID=27376 RepID=A0ACA9NHG6_9GLOM|nr:2943_t:CDS:2 [Acaulospora colombiana]